MARTLTPEVQRIGIVGLAAAMTLFVPTPAFQLIVIAFGAVAGLLVCKRSPRSDSILTGRKPGRRIGLSAFILAEALFIALPLSALGVPQAAWAGRFSNTLVVELSAL